MKLCSTLIYASVIMLMIILPAITLAGTHELDSLKKELKITKDRGVTNRILLRIAEIHEDEERYQYALKYYKRILDEKDTERDLSIQVLGNAGTIYAQVGDYANALQNYQRAYSILYEDMTSSTTANIQDDTLTLMGLKYQIANVYKSFPDYERALESYRKIAELNKQIDFIWFTVLVDMGMGDCYLNTNALDKAIEYYERAEKKLRVDGSSYPALRINLIQVLNKLGEAYYEKENFETAFSYINGALEIAKKNNESHTELSKLYLTLGKLWYGKRNYKIAEKHLLESIENSKQNTTIDIENEAWEALSKVYERSGNSLKALHAYQKHIALRDSIYSRKKLQEMTRFDMQSYFDRQNYKDSLAREEEKSLVKFEMQRQRMLTYSSFGGLALILLLSFFVYRSYNQEKRANKIISEEKQISENLLLNILPDEVADELKRQGKAEARQYDNVTVLFTDFVNFTSVGERLSPKELVEELHYCFKAFDEIIDKYDIEKIKTIGDAYLAVSGLPVPNANHANDIINAALEIQAFTKARKAVLKERSFDIRIGIHSGSLVAGIVGVKKFAYDIWGDTVNIAARMEQSGVPGKINISEHTHELIKDKFVCTYRGEIAAKHKGMLKMYFVDKSIGDKYLS